MCADYSKNNSKIPILYAYNNDKVGRYTRWKNTTCDIVIM